MPVFHHFAITVLACVCIIGLDVGPLSAETADRADEVSGAEVRRALKQAVTFFRTEVSAGGGYLWRYSADLSRREGEGAAGRQTVWVQPPGTPTVGNAYLTAYRLTGDDYLLEAAKETAEALVKGQLQSGGWDYRIEFDPKRRQRYAYRVDDNAGGRNVTTLDDDTTQSAVRFLMRTDRALDFQEPRIHDAARYALDSLLKAQYPNGAWPQRYSQFPDPEQFPVKAASYPESWSRQHPKKDYRGYYTFNDNTIADTIDTMFEAAAIYDAPQYRAAAEKAGDFILLAQMPEPQPAWAQQYDAQMHPAWARRFEPPAITGGESQGVLRILLQLYRRTGKAKYLEPVPRAIAYLKRSQLAEGRLARFYELKTNRPLFFTRDYELNYRRDDLPTHYAFVVGSKLEGIERAYQSLKQADPAELTAGDDHPPRAPSYRMTPALAARARETVDVMDERGAWVESGRLRHHNDERDESIIETRTFVRNVELLSRFLNASAQSNND